MYSIPFESFQTFLDLFLMEYFKVKLKRNGDKAIYLKPKDKRPLGKPWRGKDLIEIGWEGVDSVNLVQDRDKWWVLANTVKNLRVP